MAKTMKGITLKGLKTFKGHEGEPCIQGNIYMDGKKIGWFSDDSRGGPRQYHIDAKKEKEFNDRTEDYEETYKVGGKEFTFKGTDIFITELI